MTKRDLAQNGRTKEEVYKDLENVYRQFSAIFMDVMNSKTIDSYRTSLLERKCLLLRLKIGELLNEFATIEEQEPQNAKKAGKRAILIMMISFLISAVSPIIGIVGNLISMSICFKNIKKLQESLKNDYKKPFDLKLKEIEIVAGNCARFISKKSEDHIRKLAEDIPLSNNLLIANSIIGEYLDDNDFSLYNTDDEVSCLMVQILQDDLQTDEKDLNALLNMAKEKISGKNLEEEMKLTRKIPLNDEKKSKFANFFK